MMTRWEYSGGPLILWLLTWFLSGHLIARMHGTGYAISYRFLAGTWKSSPDNLGLIPVPSSSASAQATMCSRDGGGCESQPTRPMPMTTANSTMVVLHRRTTSWILLLVALFRWLSTGWGLCPSAPRSMPHAPMTVCFNLTVAAKEAIDNNSCAIPNNVSISAHNYWRGTPSIIATRNAHRRVPSLHQGMCRQRLYHSSSPRITFAH